MRPPLSQAGTLTRQPGDTIYASVPRIAGALPAPVVATRPAFYEQFMTDVGRSCRLRHVLVKKVTTLRLVYHNYTNYEVPSDGPIKVKASIEITSGSRIAVSFPGADANGDAWINPGGLIVSNPVALDLAAGATFWTNTRVIPGGTQYPVGIKFTGASSVGVGDGIIVSTTDYTSATNPNIDNVNQLPAYGPTCIIGSVAGATGVTPVVGVIGDSIACGYIDSSNNGAPDSGFLAKALGTARIGYVQLGMPGQGVVNFVDQTNLRSIRRKILLSGVTHVVCNYGTNDLSSRTAAQVQADLLTLYGWLTDRGITKIWQTTITPRTNGANTAAASASFGPEGGSGSERTKLNTWIKTVPAPLTGVIDVASVTQQYNAGADTFLWTAGTLQDGVHPNAAGHAAMAALVPVASFV